MIRPLVRFAFCAGSVAVLFAACREQKVRTYTVHNDTSTPTAAAPASPAPSSGGAENAAPELPPGHPPIGEMPGAANPALPPGHPPIGGMGGAPAMAEPTGDVANSIAWAAPDNWVAKPLGPMRRGSFTAKTSAGDADCSIFVFPAASNPLLANINRWRGQVGLAPIAESQLPAETHTIENGDFKFTLVDLLGKQPGATAPTRVLGAVLYRGDEAWFFKLGGPDAAVAGEKAAFENFLRTVRAAN